MSNDHNYDDWIGRSEQSSDIAEPRAIAALAALLDHDTPPWRAGELPPLGHWLCFPPLARQSDIGVDGHPKRGLGGGKGNEKNAGEAGEQSGEKRGVIPPIELPRRMWAGSRVRFLAPVPLGASIERTTTLVSATPKHGRSGAMMFITLRHDIHVGPTGVGGTRLAISEEQDLVYREEPKATTAAAAVEAIPSPAFARSFTPDPVALFRYSALTFNGHRIHYDYPYATQVEGYAGLVVHGPLTATLLLDHFLRHHPQAHVTGFSFRGLRPILANAPFTLGLNPSDTGAELVAIAPDGGAAMTATVTIQTEEITA